MRMSLANANAASMDRAPAAATLGLSRVISRMAAPCHTPLKNRISE